MKIVHLLGWYFPESLGGTEVYVHALATRLRALGHEVAVAAPDTARQGAFEYQHDNIGVFRYGIPPRPTRDEAQHREPARGAEAFNAWVSQQRPDILHIHSFTTGVGLHEIRAARLAGVRVIVTSHLPGFGYMCRSGELMERGRTPCDGIVTTRRCSACELALAGMADAPAAAIAALPVRVSRTAGRVPGPLGTALGMAASVVDYQRMQAELFSLVARFVVLNETGKRMVVANGAPPDRIAVNRLGISQAFAAGKSGPPPRPAGAPVRFGYVGRLHPTKGLIELARAVASIPRDEPFTLELRGPVPDAATRAFLDRVLHATAGDPRVRVGEAVPARQVPDVLRSYDALVAPSIWFENGPTIALEAMAAGVPVIGTRLGNFPEIIEDGVSGRLVPAGDAGALASALREIAREPSRTIDEWRRHLPEPRTMDDVTRSYLVMYEESC